MLHLTPALTLALKKPRRSPVITVPMGFYPANTTVQRNQRGTLVEVGPNVP